MVDVPIAPRSYDRRVAKTPAALLRNRFYEQNPVLDDKGSAVISRPGLRKWQEVGTGPIRKLFSAPGAFDDDLFVVSGLNLYRVDAAGNVSDKGQISTDPLSRVSMAATGNIGDVPAFLFIAEGGVLWVYSEDGPARATLQATGAISDGDTISIDGVYYKWATGGVDVGPPDGTSGLPWIIEFSGVNATDMQRMYNAINGSGEAGVEYSTNLVPHPTVAAGSVSANDLYVVARTAGAGGNGIALTESGSNLTWGSGMSGGGAESLIQVPVPDDAGAISVTHINSYVIVVPVQGIENGRFYWIEPGETTIDPLNFATAERAPDAVLQAVTYSDMFWLFGQNTTEAWITSGDPEFPMNRFQGLLYDRGQWEGTALVIKDSLFTIDPDGGVFRIKGGEIRISTPDIEEKIRHGIEYQTASGN